MKLDDFNFLLPSGLIAQEPASVRDQSRLLVVNRKTRILEHCRFGDLPQFFRPGDVLVINDTKVMPVRLRGRKESGGKVEILLVRKRQRTEPGMNPEEWECLAKGTGPLRPPIKVNFQDGVTGELLGKSPSGLWCFRFHGRESHEEVLARIGYAPLPPYIRRNGDPGRRQVDLERYQTAYAEKEGAIAAPTAGLHFTPGLLEQIRNAGVGIHPLTLHVGMGTFLPVKTEEIEGHRLEPEWFEIPSGAAEGINRARRAGHRVWAVGTTVTRAIESSGDDQGVIRPGRGKTDLFIFPGYRFRAIDSLITNFHLPRSTLLMLVSAFAGRDFIRQCYQEAIEKNYRFYSYGDAMLIL